MHDERGGVKLELKYEITIELGGGHKPVSGNEVESVIERATADAISTLLDPDELDVSVEEA
jgi:hypothetical protein